MGKPTLNERFEFPKQKNKNKNNVLIKSKMHPDIYHVIEIDLYCYEKLTK